MSYLSTTENVGFSGIPQNISEASCATQYKMAVEGVPGSCNDVNMFINDSSGDEQTYISHLNDNYFHTKFKIDPNDLYTFHDSDVIAGEITVSHTDDNYIFADNDDDVKTELLDSPTNNIDLMGSLTNGEIKEEVKTEVVSNGHYTHITHAEYQDVETTPHIFKETKTSNTKVLKTKTLNQGKDQIRSNSAFEVQKVHSPKGHSSNTTSSSKASIISDNLNSTSTSNSVSTSKNAGETFLDVFKREQGLVVSPPTVIKTEALDPSAPPPLLAAPAPKIPVSGGKKTSAGKTPAAGKTSSGKTPSAGKTPSVGKTPSSGKTPSQSKPRRGRGPAVHEALQRIHTRAVPEPTRTWHAPGHELFDLCPLDSKRPLPFTMESSSSDDDNMPDFEAGTGPVCVEESAAESRGARLALRRAALRRHVARAQTSLKLAKDYRKHRELASVIKKQLQSQKPLGTCRLPTATVNYLLTRHGMPALLTSQEKRLLRESGWSGGESGSTKTPSTSHCSEERCTKSPLPCARYCLKHIAMDPEQRLYASCAAVFAGGARCMQPLLPLQDHTPLCTEHAWKRDNYDKINRDNKPKKPPVVRKRVWPPPPRPPRKPKRRRRPHPPTLTPNEQENVAEVNVCSNSSTYDSDTSMGLSENEYIPSAGNTVELEEVGHVPPDDILDPAVLSQIPDEAFTEFFNQAEGSATFAESSELAAALEAVLDERVLDERVLDIADCVFTTQQIAKAKIQHVPAVSMQSSGPS